MVNQYEKYRDAQEAEGTGRCIAVAVADRDETDEVQGRRHGDRPGVTRQASAATRNRANSSAIV
nr:hypothetical protein [Streptomyces sp. SA15]